MTVQTTISTTTNRQVNVKRFRLWIDLVLLAGMVLAVVPFATSIPIHEWVGLLVLLPLLAHLVIDWKWIVTVSQRIFKRQPSEVRFNYWLNWTQFFLLVLATVSGIVISEAVLPTFGIHIIPDNYWIAMHEISASILIISMGVHVAMHWKWLVNAIRPIFGRKRNGAIESC